MLKWFLFVCTYSILVHIIELLPQEIYLRKFVVLNISFTVWLISYYPLFTHNTDCHTLDSQLLLPDARSIQFSRCETFWFWFAQLIVASFFFKLGSESLTTQREREQCCVLKTAVLLVSFFLESATAATEHILISCTQNICMYAHEICKIRWWKKCNATSMLNSIHQILFSQNNGDQS